MKDKTRQELEARIQAFNEEYNTSIDTNKMIDFLKEIEAIREPAGKMKESHRDFKTKYNYSYFKFLKPIFVNIVERNSKISLTEDPNNPGLYLPEMASKADIKAEATRTLRGYEYFMASCVKYTIEQSEAPDKLELDADDLVLGGNAAKTMYEFFPGQVSGNNPLNAYLSGMSDEERESDDVKMASARKILGDIRKLNEQLSHLNPDMGVDYKHSAMSTKCNLAIGELDKKVSSIYTAMLNEYKGKGILWKIFRGGDSRKMLKTFREEYASVMGVRKGRAERLMVNAATNCETNEHLNAGELISELKKEHFYENIESFRDDAESKAKFEKITDEFLTDPERKENEVNRLEFSEDELNVQSSPEEISGFDEGIGKIDKADQPEPEEQEDLGF